MAAVKSSFLGITQILTIIIFLAILIIPGLILGNLLARKWGFKTGLIVGGLLGYAIFF